MSEGPHKELLEFIERAIKIEEQAVKLYKETSDKADNAAVKLILDELGMDSGKHAKMYKTIERVLKETPYSFADFHKEKYVDKLLGREELSRHIKIEEKMIEILEEQLNITEQPTVKAILEHILEDERRHHKVLKEVIAGL